MLARNVSFLHVEKMHPLLLVALLCSYPLTPSRHHSITALQRTINYMTQQRRKRRVSLVYYMTQQRRKRRVNLVYYMTQQRRKRRVNLVYYMTQQRRKRRVNLVYIVELTTT